MIWNPGPSVDEGLAEMRAAGVEITLVHRPANARNRHRALRATLALLRWMPELYRRRRAVVHLHLDMIFLPVMAWLAGCRSVVVSLHNDELYWSSRRWRLWLRMIDRIFLGYVAISERVKDYYCAVAGLGSERIVVVRYGIDVPSRSPETRADLGLAPDAFVAGFIGRVTAQKNLGVFLEALARVPSVTGVIMGGGSELAGLQARARELGLTNLRFLPARENAAGLMPLFDLFCLPSRWEGLGLVLIEAMLQGVPVAGSTAGAIPEILGDDRGMLFSCDAPAELADVLERARNRPEETRRRAAAAQLSAADLFSVDRMCRAMLGFYRRCGFASGTESL